MKSGTSTLTGPATPSCATGLGLTGTAGAAREVGLQHGDAELGGRIRRIVRADLGAEAVLQRRDDPAPVGVVLGVGRGHQDDVERKADPVAADLDITFLEDVEQPDLDPLGQVR